MKGVKGELHNGERADEMDGRLTGAQAYWPVKEMEPNRTQSDAHNLHVTPTVTLRHARRV